jgi:Na+-translocating ferredoxin:NAD+ oxidoreductase RnfD subunit
VKVRKFFRTPKGIVVIILPILALFGAVGAGVRQVGPIVLGTVAAAMVVDAPILRVRLGKWVFPDGALLTGLFIAMILSPHEPWHVGAVTAVVAIASKYMFRVRHANVFNPAALALVATYFVYHTGQSWWGAMPEISPLALVVLIGTGIYVARHMNKMPAVVAFLGAYYLLFTVTSFVADPAGVAGLYRAPDLQAALFFAFYMVSDPPTSPPKPRDQITFGLITAVASYAVYELNRGVYFLLAGVLVANVWEAWRRWTAKEALDARRAARAGMTVGQAPGRTSGA